MTRNRPFLFADVVVGLALLRTAWGASVWSLTAAHLAPAIAWVVLRVAAHRRGPLPPLAAEPRWGLRLFLGLLACAVWAPALTTYDPTAIHLTALRQAPSMSHPLGTDATGRDLWSRWLFGGRMSFLVGLLSVAVTLTIGTTLGLLAGWFRGPLDRAIAMGTDVMLSLPRLILLMAVAGLVRPQGTAAVVWIATLLGLTGWMSLTRILRTEILRWRETPAGLALRLSGLPTRRVLTRHALARTRSLIVLYGALSIGSAMLAESGLSFLGMGVSEPTPSWGSLLSGAREAWAHAPFRLIAPGLGITLSVGSCLMMAEGHRMATLRNTAPSPTNRDTAKTP